jgi:hypothetical protein
MSGRSSSLSLLLNAVMAWRNYSEADISTKVEWLLATVVEAYSSVSVFDGID